MLSLRCPEPRTRGSIPKAKINHPHKSLSLTAFYSGCHVAVVVAKLDPRVLLAESRSAPRDLHSIESRLMYAGPRINSRETSMPAWLCSASLLGRVLIFLTERPAALSPFARDWHRFPSRLAAAPKREDVHPRKAERPPRRGMVSPGGS